MKWTDEADSNGVSDFYGLQALVCRNMIEGGECFVRLRNRKFEKDLSVPLQLQVLESEHLNNKSNQTLANGNVIRNGIEFNKLGARELITSLESIQERVQLESQSECQQVMFYTFINHFDLGK